VRTAISPEQTDAPSDGWLYAHLIQNSIQFDVGDTVAVHDYLGDIIQWSDDWGHIHFVPIRDQGWVWQYEDDEWSILFNPLSVLDPVDDLTPPMIEPVFPDSPIAFCLNETSDYLSPDSLYGDIDIIIKVTDYVGLSTWTQPAHRTEYQLEDLSDGTVVLPWTGGHTLNHEFPFYASESFEPYALVLYKRDELLVPSSWMEMNRNYYHVLTNSNGDSLLTLDERNLAPPTADYPDGDYRLSVAAMDISGNRSVDSLDICFQNHENVSGGGTQPLQTCLSTAPNPFNPATTVSWSLPVSGFVELSIYDALGRKTAQLARGRFTAGMHQRVWDATGQPSGVYFCRLKQGARPPVIWGKMLLLK